MLSKITSLMIETVGACNLRCHMCPTINYENGSHIIADEAFSNILSFIKTNDVTFIDISGWGEPLLDRKLPDRISQIKAINSDIFIMFTSNGTLFDENNTDRILASGVDQINISFDSADKNNYEKIRVNSNYDQIVVNLNLLSNKLDRYKTKLTANCVVMRDNFDDMDIIADFFSKLNFDWVCFKPLNVITSKDNLRHVINKKRIYKRFLSIKDKYSNRIPVNGFDLTDNDLINDCLGKVAKGAIFINCEGDVSPCCHLGHHAPHIRKSLIFYRQKKDFFFSFGNLLVERLEDIINKEMYRNFIKCFTEQECLPEVCIGCNLYNKKYYSKIKSFPL